MVLFNTIELNGRRFFVWFLGISTFLGYLMPKPFFKKNNSGIINTIELNGRRFFVWFLGVSTFLGYLMPKPFFKKNNSGII